MRSMRHVFLAILIFALLFTVSPFAFAQVPLQFVPVTPCRVADTRLAPGAFGGPALQGQTSRDFAIPESACGIPSTAAAYSLNVAVVPHGGLGYLTVWPAGQTRPVLATLNSVDGRIKANAAIIPAGTNQAISVYATQTTDVILDIDGYFVAASSTTLAFFPLTPCRVADTRGTNGPLGGPFLSGRLERIFPVLSSSCVIPDTAQAYSLNFAAIPHGGLGYMTVWPTGQSKPLVSTLNALTGTVTANAAIVPAGQQGAISVYPSSDTDLVIDVDGYFAPAQSGPQPLSLYALAPCRVLDTRQGSRRLQRNHGDRCVGQHLPGAKRAGLCVQRHGGAAEWPAAGLSDVVARRREQAGGGHAQRAGWCDHFQHGNCAYAEWFHRCLRHHPHESGSGYLQLLCADYFAGNYHHLAALGNVGLWLRHDLGRQRRRASLYLEHNFRQLASGVESAGCQRRDLGPTHDSGNLSVHRAGFRLAIAGCDSVQAAEHHGECDPGAN